jgi:anti-anti-sigma factor
MDVNLQIDSRDGKLIVSVLSEGLGMQEVREFGEKLDRAIVPGNATVILDFSSVKKLSSVVVGKIFRIRRRVLDAGGTFLLVASAPAVLQVLRICEIDRLVDIHHTLDEALSA